MFYLRVADGFPSTQLQTTVTCRLTCPAGESPQGQNQIKPINSNLTRWNLPSLSFTSELKQFLLVEITADKISDEK